MQGDFNGDKHSPFPKVRRIWMTADDLAAKIIEMCEDDLVSEEIMSAVVEGVLSELQKAGKGLRRLFP